MLEPLTNKKFKQVLKSVHFWLSNYKPNYLDTKNVRILTIMVLEKCMGYNIQQINKIIVPLSSLITKRGN
jgi:hypothetical protein